MKILLVNKFYYPRGGDCIYTINLEQLLKRFGHEVAVFAMQYTENLPSEWSKYFPSEVKFSSGVGMIEAFRRPFGTREVRKKFNALLDDFQPDVVHLNNIHSQLSPVIAKIAHKKGIKIVWTLHDYKMLCPRYDCMRNGKPCSLCYVDKQMVVRYFCMKNNRLASILAYLEAIMWNREKLEEYTTTFICPSDFLRNEMIRGGFNSQKLIKLNNFIDVAKITQPVCSSKENYYCYVGRLSPEKGVNLLLKVAAELPYTLRVIGSGILEQDLKQKYQTENIVFEGHKSWGEIEAIVGKAMFSIMPSECFENNPIATLESLALGTPVLGARIGGIPELIEGGGNGMLFESRNVEDLRDKIQKMFVLNFNYKEIAKAAQQKYSGENHYNELLKIYNNERTNY